MAKKIDYASMYTLRKDGYYQGKWKDQNGKWHTTSAKDPEDLFCKIQALENPEEEGPLMFSTIAQYWERNFFDKMPEGTQDSYAKSLKRAKEWFGSWEVGKIYTHDINVKLEALKKQGKAKNTVNIQRVVLRSIFHEAICHEKFGKVIRVNPVAEAKLPKGLPDPQKREAPEDDVIQAIQDAAGNVKFGDFVLFLMSTGMRRGEALAVQWRDINFETGMISVSKSAYLGGARNTLHTPKTESGTREVPILAPILPYLQRPADAKDTDYVFHGEDPSLPMANSCYQRRWNGYCRAMGYVTDKPEERTSKQNKKYIVHHYKNTLTAHVLRHGYATMLYEAGIDEKEAAALLGHKDEEMIRKVYAHLRDKKKAKASDLLKEKTKNGFVGIGDKKEH